MLLTNSSKVMIYEISMVKLGPHTLSNQASE